MGNIDKGREQTVKLGGGCMTIMERMALRLEGPTFSLHTSRGTSTACAICTHTYTRTQTWILTTKGTCTCLSFTSFASCDLNYSVASQVKVSKQKHHATPWPELPNMHVLCCT